MSHDFAHRPGSSPTSEGGGRSGLPPGTDPRKWSARFPVYQIDFTAVASGKRVAATKRRVRWRFGLSNRDALEAGETGTACRGEEHDVTIVWSVTSGKRLILADGQEVHYSTNRGGVLEYSWTMRGNHVLKVVAHAAPAMSATPGFRQYDLFIDGQSFFNMPKVYELGLKGPIPSHARTPGVVDYAERDPPRAPPVGLSPTTGGHINRHYDLSEQRYVGPEVPRSRAEEEEDLQRAISASIEESRQHLSKNLVGKHRNTSFKQPAESAPAAATAPAPPPAPRGGGDLLDMGAAAAAAPAPSSPPAVVAAPSPTYDQFAAAPPPAPAAVPTPAPSYDQFAAAQPPPPQAGALVAAAPQAAGAYYAQQAGTAAAAGSPPVAPTPAPYDFGAAPPPAADPFAPQPAADPFAPQASAVDDPFAPKPAPPPNFNAISSSILGAYGASADAGSAAGSAPLAISPSGASQPESFPGQPAAPTQGAVDGLPFAAPQVTQLSVDTKLQEEEKEDEPKDEVGKLMRSIVNIDDITSPVENLSLNPFADDREKEEKEKEKAQKQKKSRGIPPPAAKWTGAQPSLSEMQEIKPAQSGEKKPVMTNPFDANAANTGALVLHGSQNGGPPPINQPTGFGVGANISGGGYGGNAAQPGVAPQQQAGYGAPPMQQAGYGGPPVQQQAAGYSAPPPQQYQQPQQGYANYQY